MIVSRPSASPAWARFLLAEAIVRSHLGSPTHTLDLLDLLVLLGHCLDSLLLPFLKHSCSSSFLDHSENLCRLHIEHFGDLALHDEEIRVVDVELHGLKKILDRLQCRLVSVEEVLGNVSHGDLR